jgi:GNAT superfamily N-acetyltransferase
VDGIEIRVATAKDFSFLQAVEHYIDSVLLRRKVQTGEIFLACVGDEPVGWLRFGWFWDEIPFMYRLEVLDRWRKQGIGALLVRHWEEAMKAAGVHSVYTSTQADETAQHFYRKLGYNDIGGFIPPGDPLELILVKRLS